MPRGRVNTTSPPSCWTTARAMQIPKPGAPSPPMEATTRSSSSKRSRSTQPGSPRRSWPRSPAARTPQPLSNDSCGSCGVLRGLDRIVAAGRSSAWKRQEGEDDGTHTVAARAAPAWPASTQRPTAGRLRRGASEPAARNRRTPRKDFLKRTGPSAPHVAVAGPAGALVRSARGATAPRIAIVGGGIAGLTAALTLAGQGLGSTVYEAHPSRIGGRMHSDFVDSRATGPTARRASLRRADRHGPQDDPRRSPALPPGDRRPARRGAATASRTRTASSAATTPRTQADERLPAGARRRCSATCPRRAIRRPTIIHDRRRIALDHMSVYEWIESPRARRPPLAVRAAARRRLQHRVRRRDDRPVRAEPRLPARLQGRRRQLLDLRRVRRALPHRRRQRPAPAGDRDALVPAQGAAQSAWAGG